MDKELLESWKEISAYLNRNIRTCQYWEKKHDLPIHRLEDSPKARVFAYKKELDRWMQEKLHGVEKKNKIPAIFVFVFLFFAIIFVITFFVFRKDKAAPPSSIKPSVVIMPFDNDSRDENLEYFRLVLPDMLFAGLSQSRHVFVFPRDAILSTLFELDLYESRTFSSEDLRNVARNLDVSHIILGRYLRLGETFGITIEIKNAHSMKSLDIKRIKGPESSLSSKFDELTIWIKAHLNLTDEAIHDKVERVGQVRTEFPEAYKYYIEGRNFFNLNKDDKSIESMEKALEIDQEFASAFKSISESYLNMGLLSKSQEYAAWALKFNERFSDRERYYFQMQHYGSLEETWYKAIKAGLNLVQDYPDHIGGINLAELYLSLEQWDSAIEFYQVFVLNQEVSPFPYKGIASSYEAKGMYDKSSQILKDYLHDIYENPAIRWQLAFLYLCQGKYDLALEEAEKLDPPNSDIKGYIFHCSGELDKAEREYFNMRDSRFQQDIFSAHRLLGSLYLMQERYEEAENQLLEGVAFANEIGELSWKHEIHSELSYFYLASGKPEKAFEECNSALEYAALGESIRRQVDSLHLKGLILVDVKLLDDAMRISEELKDLIENWLNPKLLRFYYHLIGRIEHEKENFSAAIGHFRNAVSRLPNQYYEWNFRIPMPHALFYESLAKAYYESGKFELAKAEYEKINGLTIGKLWFANIFTKK